MKKGKLGAILLALVLIIGLVCCVVCLEKIPAGYVGVVYNMNGGVDGEVLEQGWHLVAPTKKVTKYSIGIEQSYLTAEDKGDSPKVGCCLAVALSNRFSKDKTYVNVIMSDNLEAMQEFRDFLATHHITNVAADSYTLDWSKKSITITAYAETKAQSKLIDDYIANSSLKFKRVISRS